MEVEMDHYSLETLAKLHQKELIQAGLREQAVQRQKPRARLIGRFKGSALLLLSLIMLGYWLSV